MAEEPAAAIPRGGDPTVGSSPYGEYPGPDSYRRRVAKLARRQQQEEKSRRRVRFWGGIAGVLELAGLTTFGVVVLRQGRPVGLLAVGIGLWLGYLGVRSLAEAWQERRRRG